MPDAPKIRRLGKLDDLFRPWHDLDDSWMADAACEGSSLVVQASFFADVGSGYTRSEARLAVLEAKALCLGCDVQAECLAFALAGDLRGIWGGTTHEERLKIRQRADRRRKRQMGSASTSASPAEAAV